MKRTLNSVIIIAISFLFFNATIELEKNDIKTAILNFETEVIDYGTVLQNSNGVRQFTFTNTGSAPLLITKIRTSCGCTVPSYSKAPILPGETGELEIKYDTSRLGAFTKTVTVISNAKSGNRILKIKGKIIASK